MKLIILDINVIVNLKKNEYLYELECVVILGYM